MNLQKRIKSHTIEHIKREIRGIGLSRDALKNSIAKHAVMEERFVHALSILWWGHYNQQLGFPPHLLEERFAEYNQPGRYAGAVQLSKHISKIGIQNAITTYVNDPNELFRGL